MEVLNPVYWIVRGSQWLWLGTLATMDFIKFVLVPLVLAYAAILLIGVPAG